MISGYKASDLSKKMAKDVSVLGFNLVLCFDLSGFGFSFFNASFLELVR